MDDDELVTVLKRKFKNDDAWKDYVIEKLAPSKEALRLLDESRAGLDRPGSTGDGDPADTRASGPAGTWSPAPRAP